jgi:hypothetical protein
MTIEDIILDRDRRGIADLRPHMTPDFCDQAAELVLDNPGTALIVTGFYILTAGAPETDGPPGAIAIGNALEAIGYRVVYVTDLHTAPLMSGVLGSDDAVVDFPITDDASSKAFAADLLNEHQPSLLISIERCGLTDEGVYRNMRNLDITRYTARVDHLFTDHPASVGIGDGGNEIGLGNLSAYVPTVPTLVEKPCMTTTTRLVIASVSNWGGYGLVAAMSLRKGRNLLPTIEEERDLVRKTADHGAVDGMSSKSEYRVDGFSLDENSETLVRLHDLIAVQGVSA